MKRSVLKLLLIISVVTLGLGGVLFATAIAVGGGIRGLSTTTAEIVTYSEPLSDTTELISLDFDTDDIEIVFGNTFSLSYPVKSTKNGKPFTEVSVVNKDNTLSVSERNVRHFSGFDIVSDDYKVTLTIPYGRALALNIETDTGDVRISGEGEFFTRVDIESDTGDVYLNNLKSTTLEVSVNTADVELRDIEVGDIDVESDTGDVEFTNVICETLTVETDTGDVSCDDGLLDAQTIAISTETGDVELDLVSSRSEYSVSVRTRTGHSNVSDFEIGTRKVNVETDTGDIEIQFEN